MKQRNRDRKTKKTIGTERLKQINIQRQREKSRDSETEKEM